MQDYPAELPITAHREQIVSMLRDHQVIVVCGETGSGKSTQLPKFCLEAGLGQHGMIGHTQPRRLAARSIAARIAEELQTTGDSRVGYKIRFGDQTSDRTLIKLMTDGILLAETQSDRQLRAYSAIIIDEAHERSLNIDFLLGYLHGLLDKRPDLKLIITSATIDAERFAEHFGVDQQPAPIITVEGRGYPVEVRYLPWSDVSASAAEPEDDYDLARHVIAGIDAVMRCGEGDVLVFLPTERDIREVSHRTAGHFKRLGLSSRVDALPLYARLPQSEQQRIFHPTGNKRRIVFSTNVAESSLTVPGIRYVVDSGTARISRYSARSKVQRLPIEPISRASADQRAGRCGRVAPGVCIRLYDEADYQSRDAFTTPEIRRTNLASVILQTKTLRLGDIESFPFLDPPRPEAIREGLRTLREIGAIDRQERLTEIGTTLGRMPVDPRVGRMLIAADQFGVLPELLVIAAAIEIQDPRERPPDKRQAADEVHAQFQDSRSDFLSYLKLWRFYQARREDVSRSKLDRVCRSHFLSAQRMREWADVYRQLKGMTAQSFGASRKRTVIGPPRYADDDDKVVPEDRYATIHQAILTGVLSGVAMAGDKNEYTGAGGLKLFLWPGSGVFAAKPKWIVAGELVETTRQYARTVAAIQPQWIEQLAGHLVKRNYSDPHWSKKAGAAFCYEQVSLFGLPIVTRRRTALSPIDPGTARELMIEHGLVEDEIVTTARAVLHNRRLVVLIEELAAKTRSRQFVVDPFDVRDFYASRLPEDVCDRARLEKLDRQTPPPDWVKQLSSSQGLAAWLEEPPTITAATGEPYRGLYMQPEDLIKTKVSAVSADAFPNELVIGETRLPLQYRFEPGAAADGVSITVHQAALSQLSDDRLGWLVPGLLEPKLVALIKSLPKRIRRNLVPAADIARLIAKELAPHYGKVPFLPAVCDAMSRHADMPVSPSDFTDEKIEDHLEFLIHVIDDEGKTVAQSRSATELRSSIAADLGQPADAAVGDDDAAWSRSAMTTFDIDELPAQVVRQRGGVQVAQFPSLVDCGDHVETRLFSDAATAASQLQRGLMRLYAISERKELRSQVRWIPGLAEAKIRLAPILPSAHFEDALVDLLARRAFVEQEPNVRTRAAFARIAAERAKRIAVAAQEIALWLGPLADAYQAARAGWESYSGSRAGAVIADVRHQIQWLTPKDFLSVTPWQWLKQYPRYLQAVAYRFEKLRQSSAPRDDESMRLLQDLWSRWLARLAEGERLPELQTTNEFRWTFEELRVSLFAQPLGTSIKTSPQRCEKLLLEQTSSRA
ncbi:MAG: ATP-dependent RNA helicase HrpA [Planctomycetaceae bacterium]